MRYFPFILIGLILISLISTAISEETKIWNKDTYIIEGSLPAGLIIDDILEKEKKNRISQGVSEEYFNKYFHLESVNIINGSVTINFNLNIGEYTAHVMNTTKLHEINKIIPGSESVILLKNCIGDYESAEAVLNHDGTLLLQAISTSGRYIGSVNLENGTCERVDQLAGVKNFFENPYVTYYSVDKTTNSSSNQQTLIYFIISFVVLILLLIIKLRS